MIEIANSSVTDCRFYPIKTRLITIKFAIGFTTHLMKRIEKGPVRGISLKLQEMVSAYTQLGL